MQTKVLRIHPKDNVAVALTVLYKGEQISHPALPQVEIQENIPAKHKYALVDLNEGDEIYMYGVLVGRAIGFIPKGGLLSVKNVKHAAGSFELKERHTEWHKPDVTAFQNKTFNGYHRADGSVGTRNFWVVIPMVFCENKNVDVLQEAFMKALGYAPKNHLMKLWCTA